MTENKDSLLYNLDLPHSLNSLSRQELDQICDEIRTVLLSVGEKCGGHLASNLGVVELTVALHSVFNSPVDKFFWDTSHQCYVHKMLTGRLSEIFSIRQKDGLSGFAKRGESEHDSFGAGHASTALSAALGQAHARNINDEDYSVISVFGDSALSGGMAFEALNNAAKLNSNFIGILNDNNMSISRPVGAMAEYITQLRTSGAYDIAKEKFERIFENIPMIGVPLKRRIEKTVERLRDIVLNVKEGVLFEEFGFKYLGPLDGHNLPLVMGALRYAKTYPGPILIHIITQKGRGHLPAENDPIKFHGVSPTPNEPPKVVPIKKASFTEFFGNKIVEIAKKDQSVVVVTPAMMEGSGLKTYAATFPDRFFDVGIAEEHAVTFCAGLACGGIKPILAIYSTFLQRGYDQVIHDVCLQKLPVVFAIDRAGVVGEDGPTHHGVFDLTYLIPIPHLVICAPKDGKELEDMLEWAVNEEKAVAIRYPRGSEPSYSLPETIDGPFEMKPQVLIPSLNKDKKLDVLLIGVGGMASLACEAAEQLKQDNIVVSAINLRLIKPIDTDFLVPFIEKSANVIVIEDGMSVGGVS